MTNEKLGTSGLKIDLCCGNPSEGESRNEGWLKHDIDNTISGVDIVCNLLDIDKHVQNNSCKELRLSHALEHFTIPESKIVLKKLYKLLETDGKLTIIVPNFKWHAQLVLEGKEEEANYYCFGGQLDEYDLHKQGWTRNRLKKAVIEAGFALVAIDDESSITCLAIKP